MEFLGCRAASEAARSLVVPVVSLDYGLEFIGLRLFVYTKGWKALESLGFM